MEVCYHQKPNPRVQPFCKPTLQSSQTEFKPEFHSPSPPTQRRRMGCNCSNLSGVDVIAGNIRKKTAELTFSYEEARSLIPELRSSTNTLPTLKRLVRNNQALLFFATEHLKFAVSAMNILSSVKLALAKARERQAILLQALNCYEREQQHKSSQSYSQTLSKLKEFKEAGDPFAVLGEFAALCGSQGSVFQELKSKEEELRAKARSTKRWKKVCKVIPNIVFISVLILSVVPAAAAAPPLATVAVAAAGMAVKTAEQWADSVWDGRLQAVEGEKEVVSMMMKGGVGAHELESVRAMMRRLEIKMGSIEGDARFAVERGEGEEVVVEMAVEEVKGKVVVVEEWIERVEMKVEACESEVRKVAAQFLNVIANDL